MTKARPRAPRFTVEVTAELISDSKQRDSSHCMIAEAVKAAYPNARYVSVDLQTIRLTDPSRGLRYTYLTPRLGQVALVNFDQGVNPEPFNFQLRNGQVTSAGRARRPRQEVIHSDATRQKKKSQMTKARLSKQTLVRGTKGSVPDKVGGKTPPLTPFARVRAFGLRALSK